MKSSWVRGSLPVGLCLCALLVTTTASGQPFTTVINVPPDPDPGSIGSDTQLNLFDGGGLGEVFVVGDKFVPATNMEVNISGGQVGRQFLAFSGSTVNISGGAIGDDFTAFAGSTVNLSGGTVGHRFGVTGTLNMSGGSIDKDFRPGTDSTINISGGTISEEGSFGGGFTIGFGSTINISGGVVPKFTAFSSGVNISGGNVGEVTPAFGSVLTVFGGEFEVDGVPVPGLDAIGDTVTLTATSGLSDLLTGTLTDGAVLTDDFYEVTLVATALPIKSSVINTPADPAPLGLRAGQTLNLSDGGALVNHFATVNANLNMAGGAIGEDFFSVNSDVSITGGTIGDNFTARSGGTISISGGEIGNSFYAFDGVTVNISKDAVVGFAQFAGATVNISGGSVNSFAILGINTINISGGTFGSFIRARDSNVISLLGSSFILDGVDLTPSLTTGESFAILDRDVVLEGILADGSPFSYDLASTSDSLTDFFDPNATLTVTLVPGPGAVVLLGAGGLVMLRRRGCGG